MSNSKVIAIILAGGSSERFGFDMPKQFVKLGGKMVIEHTLKVFNKHKMIDEIFIVVHPSFRYLIEQFLVTENYFKVKKVLNGGKTRQESTKIGIEAIEDPNCFVLVHDAVRPFISENIISKVIKALEEYEAVDVVIPSTDTIVKREKDIITEIPDRDQLMLGQTPQGFRYNVIKNAYELFEKNPVKVSDDCGLVVKYSLGRVGIVIGGRFNIKITYPEDIYLADKILQLKSIEISDSFVEYDKLKEKVVVIFGGNSGIGKEIGKQAEKKGANVFLFSRSNGCNVANPEHVSNVLKSVYEKVGKIDFVVNTAAILNFGPIIHRTYESIAEEIMTNYYGNIVVAKESFCYLKESKGGLLLFTSSSYTRGRALYGIYSSTKAATVNFVQALAEEWEQFDVRVNVINPERTNTEMRRRAFGVEDPSTLLPAEFVAEQAIKVLLSDFTGQVIDVKMNGRKPDLHTSP